MHRLAGIHLIKLIIFLRDMGFIKDRDESKFIIKLTVHCIHLVGSFELHGRKIPLKVSSNRTLLYSSSVNVRN